MTDFLPVPCISLHRPWSYWVALGWKTIETRIHNRFKLLAGREIAIHSAKAWDDSAYTLAAKWLTPEMIAITEGFPRDGEGEILCVTHVTLTRKLLPADSREAMIDCGDTLRFGLFLGKMRWVAGVRTKGQQGMWPLRIPLSCIQNTPTELFIRGYRPPQIVSITRTRS